MSGDTSNTSNVSRKLSPLKRVQIGGAVIMWAFEMFVLAEILYWYLSDGEQTFHGAVHEYLEGLQERIDDRAAFAATVRNGIDNLPETDNES